MDNDSLYQPSGQRRPGINATYVPDLYRQVAAEMRAEEGHAASSEPSQQTLVLQRRPIIGVMYSISACMEGELFPIYVGRNIIGSDPSSDICLRETSVSPAHGLLLARKQLNDLGEESISVFLSDNNSDYGIMVNGEKLSFEKVECKDGDVITIGRNYVLILSLFNAINKLSFSYNFERIPEPEPEPEEAPEPQPQAQAEEAAVPESSVPEIIKPVPLPQRDDMTTDSGDHSNNDTLDPAEDDDSSILYKPTQHRGQDHYNNKTIIL